MQRMLKVLQKNKKNIIINIVFIIIIAVFWWSTDIGDIKEYYVDRSDNANNYTFYVYGESQVFQTILCNTDGINELEIPIDTQKDRYRGEFKVTLADEDSNPIQEWNTDKGVLYADKWIEYKLDEPLKKGETYNLIISATGLDLANAIEVTGTGTLNIANEDLNVSYLYCYYNGEINGCVAFAAFKYHPNVFAIIAVVLVMMVLNVFLYYDSKGADITKYSFISIFLLGLIMLTIFSPASGPDEDFHYNTSLALSNVLLGRDNISEVEQEYVFDYVNNFNANNNFQKIVEDIFRIRTIDNSTVTLGTTDRVGNLCYPAGHIVPAVGMAIGRIIGLNGVQLYTLARLFNLFAYAIIVSIAIEIMPIKKDLLFVYAINPMILHQATQLSYDNIINCTSILFFAYVLMLALGYKMVKWIDIIIITILLVIFGPIKIVYIMHMLLLMLIPSKNFKGVIDKSIKIVFVVACIIVFMYITDKALYLSYISNDLIVNGQDSVATLYQDLSPIVEVQNYNSFYTISDFVSNPVSNLLMWIKSFNINIWMYIENAYGSLMSGLSVSVFEYVIYAYIVALLIVTYENDGANKVLRIPSKCIIISVATMEIILIAAAGFTMTEYGATILQGIQGRYFLPCLLLINFGILSNNIKIDVLSKKVNYLIVFIYIGIIFSVLSQIEY